MGPEPRYQAGIASVFDAVAVTPKAGTIECPACAERVEAVALLERLRGFYEGMAVAVTECPACAASVELTVGGGRLLLGYTYWAGALHFEGLTEASLGAIRITGDGGDRAIELDGRAFRAATKG